MSSGTSDTVYSAQANLDAHGKSIPPILEREKNLSRIVKIIADQKLLFKGDELKARKASKKALTEKQKEQNSNNVRNGLFKTWGVSTTNRLLNSGKVVICRSNEEFIDRIVKDELADRPGKTEEEIRAELEGDGLDKETNWLFDTATGKIYLNGQNLTEEEAGSVLAHEVGVHAAKDAGFKELIEDIEDRVAQLMEEGLKSKAPAAKNFWKEVERRMNDANETSREERLAYFLEVYVNRHGVVPQSIQSQTMESIGRLKKWLLDFLGTSTMDDRKAAEVLCDVVRAYAEEANESRSNQSARKPSRAIKGTSEGTGKETTYYVSTESGRSTPDLAWFDGFKGATDSGFPADYPAGPVRMEKGHLRYPDDDTDHLTGTGMLHRMNNAMVDKTRMPPNYTKGDLAENVMRELSRNLSGGAQAVYAISRSQVMVKTKGGLGVLLAWKGKDQFWSVQTVYSKSMMARKASERNEWKGVLKTRGGAARPVARHVSDYRNQHSNSAPARTAPSFVRPADDRLSAGRNSLETFSEPQKIDNTTLEAEVNDAVKEAGDKVMEAYDNLKKEMDSPKLRKASRKAPDDSHPRKRRTPEEMAKAQKEKLAKMAPKERERYLLDKQIKEQKKLAEGNKRIDETTKEIKDFKDLQDGKSPESVIKERKEKATGEEKEKLGAFEKVLAYVKRIATAFNNNFLKFTDKLIADVGKLSPEAGEAAKKWWKAVTDWGMARQRYRAEAREIYTRFEKLSKESKDAVEKLCFDSTIEDKWAFDISHWDPIEGDNLVEGRDFVIDEELRNRYGELWKKDKEAAKVVYEVLKHGYDRYRQKKMRIDATLKALMGEEKFLSMVKMQAVVKPYVPLVRTGQYNVTWRSNELKAQHLLLKKLLEKRDEFFEKNPDKTDKDVPEDLRTAIDITEKKIDEMEKDENHYVVSRFDSLSEAMDLQLLIPEFLKEGCLFANF